MPDSERQLGVIKDILLPLDNPTRYDVVFTDKRIAIVCMGHSSRFEHIDGYPSSLYGIAPTALPNTNDKQINRQKMEEEINSLPLNKKLELSKKSCFYTYEEIEEVKLISGKKPKFIILSEECVSKFAPNQEQFMQLLDFLPTFEMLKGKTSILGNSGLRTPQEESNTLNCKYCGSKNDSDALFCERCGMKIKDEINNYAGLICSSCGAENKNKASFCKKCGSPTHA